MSLLPSSRYFQVTDPSGKAVTQRKVRSATRYATVTTAFGQTFQEIAAIHLGDPGLYWRVADLNPHVPYPDEIPMGTRLRLPRV
jgi:uncharacterized protein YcbX